jgi:hypothetical protein
VVCEYSNTGAYSNGIAAMVCTHARARNAHARTYRCTSRRPSACRGFSYWQRSAGRKP